MVLHMLESLTWVLSGWVVEVRHSFLEFAGVCRLPGWCGFKRDVNWAQVLDSQRQHFTLRHKDVRPVTEVETELGNAPMKSSRKSTHQKRKVTCEKCGLSFDAVFFENVHKLVCEGKRGARY